MSTKEPPEPYRIALRRYIDSKGTAQGLLIDRRTYRPSVVGSLYSASCALRYSSPNTIYRYLQFAQAFLSWGVEKNIDLERRLLDGRALPRAKVEGFSFWLEERLKGKHKDLPQKSISTFNAYLRGAEDMVGWFIDQCLVSEVACRAREIQSERELSSRLWRNVRKSCAAPGDAPDLTDDEILNIETFLKGLTNTDAPEPRWVRAYLIWRLAIEFGMRIGEILALRLEDCPTLADPSFRIVRMEDRPDSFDPRRIYAPRPKTLGRALAPVISNTVFPHLVVDYQADHRMRNVSLNGKGIVRRPVMSHTYLLVNDKGVPLSPFTAKSLACAISAKTGIPFTWHLARHAFFNRAYAKVASIADPTVREVRIQDLVYWGGWRNASSLEIYTRRTRGERAQMGIAIWNGAHEPMEALG